MPSQAKDIRFPLGGVDKLLAFQSQEPYTCVDAMNVWPRDSIAGRMRGGSRPGLRKVFSEQLGGPVHLLSQVRVIEGDEEGAETHFADSFNVDLIEPRWFPSNTEFPTSGYANISRSLETVVDGTVRLKTYGSGDDRFPLDQRRQAHGDMTLHDRVQNTSKKYEVSLGIGLSLKWDPFLDPLALGPDRLWGNYVIHLQMHNTLPTPWRNSLSIVLQITESRAKITMLEYSNGSRDQISIFSSYIGTQYMGDPVVFKAWIDDSGNAHASAFEGRIATSGTFTPAGPAGRRVGFSLYEEGGFEHPGSVLYHVVENFKMTYFGTTPAANRNVVVALGGTNAESSSIDIRFEDTPDALIAPVSKLDDGSVSIKNNNAAQLVADESLGRLYIVGEPDHGAGTEDEEIWVFDATAPSGAGTGVITDIQNHATDSSSSGTPPTNCLLVAVWRNRVCVVQRGDQQNIVMGKVGVPVNWSYGSIPIGTATKLSTTGIDAGRVSEPINALIAHSDDYLIIGCANSLYLLRGDPTLSGQIDRLSSSIGIVSPQAWARGPNGETVFLSNDGLYGLAAGPNSYPQSVSREKLPQELRDIDVVNNRVLMEYDVRNRGVFIGITPLVGGGGKYFWFDWEFRGFWPMSFNSAHEPLSLVYRKADASDDQRIMLGCRDGYIRSFFDNATSDDGLPLESHILIGPLMLGGGGYYDGMLREVIAQLGNLSGQVKCEVLVGRSAEDALGAKPVSPLRLTAGKNKTIRPCRRGNAAFIKLSSSDRWALENLTIVKERLGKQRL